MSIVINHKQKSHSKSAFPAKPFFGVDPVIIHPEKVNLNRVNTMNIIISVRLQLEI